MCVCMCAPSPLPTIRDWPVCMSERKTLGRSKVPISIMYNLSTEPGEGVHSVCVCNWKWAQVSCSCVLICLGLFLPVPARFYVPVSILGIESHC